jgi:hypothetical protein
MSWESHTRRGFVRGAVGGALAAAVGGLAFGFESAGAAPNPLAGAVSEVDVLTRLMEIEQTVVFCYRHVIAQGRLSPRTGSTLRRFLNQELEHVRTLASELSRRGGKPPAPPTSIVEVDRELGVLAVSGRLEQAKLEWQVLNLLTRIETAEEQAYYNGVLKVRSATLATLFARSLTCDAQHWTVLSELSHAGDVERAVPHAFVPLAPELRA